VLKKIKEQYDVLIACEFSGVVRDAFIQRGFRAISCDILPTETKGPHYQGDVRDLLGIEWELLIAHPPCTHLAVSGAKHFEKKKKDGRQQKAIEFFMSFVQSNAKRYAIENPVCIMSTKFRKPDQIIQPYQFGDPYQKTTCLWLKSLPHLLPTQIVDKGEMYVSASGKTMPAWSHSPKVLSLSQEERSKLRSKTFPGIAEAMAKQWGDYVFHPEKRFEGWKLNAEED
jgi:site-specific DNA-cytosine methylase